MLYMQYIYSSMLYMLEPLYSKGWHHIQRRRWWWVGVKCQLKGRIYDKHAINFIF